MAVQDGYKSYLIMGNQTTDWDTPCLLASMEAIIYELISSTLKNVSPPVKPARFRGHPSPIRQMNSFVNAEGDIVVQLHADNLLLWWMQILQAAAVTSSTDFVEQEVYGDGLGAGKAFSSPVTLDTQPGATDPTSNPGKLHFTLDQSDSGVITIVGTDQNGLAITDTVTIAAATEGTSTLFFETVNAAGITYTGLAVATTLLIECDKDTYTHIIPLGDDVLKGLTIELVKGNLPSTYIGCLFNLGVLDIGDTLTLTTNVLAKRGYNRAKVPAAGVVPTDSVTPTDVSGYTRINEEVLPGWGTALYLEGGASAISIASGSFAFGNALASPLRYRNVRTRPKPRRSGDREIMLTVGIEYEDTPDYDLKFYHNQVMQAKLEAIRKPYASREYKITIDMPRTQITASPDPDVGDYMEMIQTLALEPIRSAAASTSDEVVVTLVCPETG